MTNNPPTSQRPSPPRLRLYLKTGPGVFISIVGFFLLSLSLGGVHTRLLPAVFQWGLGLLLLVGGMVLTFISLRGTGHPPEETHIPADLLGGAVNSHSFVRLGAVVYIGVIWLIANRAGENAHILLSACIAILASIAFEYMQCWSWSWERRDIQLGIGLGRKPWRWACERGSLRVPRYPWHPLLVDMLVLTFLIAVSGGIGSIFIPLYVMITAAGDTILETPRFGRFTVAVLVSYGLGCLAAFGGLVGWEFFSWVPQHSSIQLLAITIKETEGSQQPSPVAASLAVNASVYWAAAAFQAIGMAGIGYILNNTSQSYAEHSRRSSGKDRNVFQSGEVCPQSGQFVFVGYLDESTTPNPTTEEARITLATGEPFPPFGPSGSACLWRLDAPPSQA